MLRGGALALATLSLACNDTTLAGGSPRGNDAPQDGPSPSAGPGDQQTDPPARSPRSTASSSTLKAAPKDEDARATAAPAATATPVPAKKQPITPQSPKTGCQAFFSGLLLADHPSDDVAQIYRLDQKSEWVGGGRYPSNRQAFPHSIQWTFDGIAFDKGTHVTIYAEADFQGAVLYDGHGPIVLNNGARRIEFPELMHTYIDRPWTGPVAALFPPETHKESDSDMVHWTNGSTVIECDAP